jgi:hypothetical protein
MHVPKKKYINMPLLAKGSSFFLAPSSRIQNHTVAPESLTLTERSLNTHTNSNPNPRSPFTMLSLKFILTLAVPQFLAAAAPIADAQGGFTLVPVVGGGSRLLNTPTGGPASIYTEIQSLPIKVEPEMKFEG